MGRKRRVTKKTSKQGGTGQTDRPNLQKIAKTGKKARTMKRKGRVNRKTGMQDRAIQTDEPSFLLNLRKESKKGKKAPKMQRKGRVTKKTGKAVRAAKRPTKKTKGKRDEEEQEMEVEHVPSDQKSLDDLPEEIILAIMKYLPALSLIQLVMVSKRYHRIAEDKELWVEIDLQGQTLKRNALNNILLRDPLLLKIERSMIDVPRLKLHRRIHFPPLRLQGLSLCGSNINNSTLNYILSFVPNVLYLGLEECTISYNVCRNIARCRNLRTLRLSKGNGLTEPGLRSILLRCTRMRHIIVNQCDMTKAAKDFLSDWFIDRFTMGGYYNSVLGRAFRASNFEPVVIKLLVPPLKLSTLKRLQRL